MLIERVLGRRASRCTPAMPVSVPEKDPVKCHRPREGIEIVIPMLGKIIELLLCVCVCV